MRRELADFRRFRGKIFRPAVPIAARVVAHETGTTAFHKRLVLCILGATANPLANARVQEGDENDF
jgi:hypothetical protein